MPVQGEDEEEELLESDSENEGVMVAVIEQPIDGVQEVAN